MPWSRSQASFRRLSSWADALDLEIVGRIDRKHIIERRAHPDILADYYDQEQPAPLDLDLGQCKEAWLRIGNHEVPLFLEIDGARPEVWLMQRRYVEVASYGVVGFFACGAGKPRIFIATGLDGGDVPAMLALLEDCADE
jgi:hypothetical protein